MLTKRNVILFLAATGFLLLAVGLEHPFFHRSAASPNSSIVFSEESIVGLSRELAFALLIALIVSIGIEREVREADQARADRLRREIAEDVFGGVFSRQLPKDFVDLVISTHLSPTVLREAAHLSFILEPLSREDLFHGLDPLAVIRLRTKYNYRIRNVSGRAIAENQTLRIPLRGGRSRNIAKLLSLKAGLAKSMVDIPHESRPVEGATEVIWPVNLDVGESIDLAIEVVVAKDINDSEVWGTRLPTLATDFDFTNKIPDLRLGMTARTASPVRQIYFEQDHSSARWQIDGPMLTNETITMWWEQSSASR